MNQRPPGSSLPLSSAIEGFLQYKIAEALNPRTIECYKRDLTQWLAYVGDLSMPKLTTDKIRAYLAYMRTDYKPRRIMVTTACLFLPKHCAISTCHYLRFLRGRKTNSRLIIRCARFLRRNSTSRPLKCLPKRILKHCSKRVTIVKKHRRQKHASTLCAVRPVSAITQYFCSCWIQDYAPASCVR